MITKKDLLKEISQKELLQLTDLNATGSLNQDVLNDAIADASSFISSFINIPNNPTPLLKQIATELTIYELRKKNNLTLSKESKDRLKELENYLTKMAAKKIPTSLKEEQQLKIKNSNYAFKHKEKKLNTKGYL